MLTFKHSIRYSYGDILLSLNDPWGAITLYINNKTLRTLEQRVYALQRRSPIKKGNDYIPAA